MRSLKRREEEKREQGWDAVTRWRVIQDTITWAEAQDRVRRNDPAKRRREETAKLREMSKET